MEEEDHNVDGVDRRCCRSGDRAQENKLNDKEGALPEIVVLQQLLGLREQSCVVCPGVWHKRVKHLIVSEFLFEL